MLFQVLLRHYDIVEIFVGVYRKLRAATVVDKLLLLQKAASSFLANIELILEEAVGFILFLSKLPRNLPPSKPSNTLVCQRAL